MNVEVNVRERILKPVSEDFAAIVYEAGGSRVTVRLAADGSDPASATSCG
jgi:hypothetical protein